MNPTTSKNKIIPPVFGFLGILIFNFFTSVSLILPYWGNKGTQDALILFSLYSFSGILFMGSQIFSSFFLANALCNNPKSILFHLTAPLSFLMTAGLSSLWLDTIKMGVSLLSLLYYIGGFFLFLSFTKQLSKTSAIIRATCGSLVLVIIAFVSQLLFHYGLDGQLLAKFFTDFKQALIPNMEQALIQIHSETGVLEKALEAYNQSAGGQMPLTVEQFAHILSDTTVNSFLLTVPALLVGIVNVFSYCSSSLLYKVRSSLGTGIDPEKRKLNIAPAGLLIFMISFVLYNIFGMFSGGSVFSLVCMTVAYIYQPLLMVMGIRYLFSKNEKPLLKKPLFIVLFVILFLFSPALMLALCGANEAMGQFRKNMENRSH